MLPEDHHVSYTRTHTHTHTLGCQKRAVTDAFDALFNTNYMEQSCDLSCRISSEHQHLLMSDWGLSVCVCVCVCDPYVTALHILHLSITPQIRNKHPGLVAWKVVIITSCLKMVCSGLNRGLVVVSDHLWHHICCVTYASMLLVKRCAPLTGHHSALHAGQLPVKSDGKTPHTSVRCV